MPFTIVIRPRYAEVDMQGVVFNAHWLTYFDEACTRFFEHLGYAPKETFAASGPFDAMVVKAVLEWRGPAGFDDEVTIAVRPARLGTKSFDLTNIASVDGRPACEGTITYVSVKPGTHDSCPIPDELRGKLEAAQHDV
jgi:acyl-CoA thioester hydrolase